MDVIYDNIVVGERLNGTLMGATSPTTDAKRGQAMSIYHQGEDGYIDLGIHKDVCLGVVSNCNHQDNTITVALWVKLHTTTKSGIFTNNGGLRFYIDQDTSDLDIYLDCANEKYAIENIIVSDPAGWNHYVIMCSRSNATHVIVNGVEWFGKTGTPDELGTSGRVTLGLSYTKYDNAFLVDELKIWYSALDMAGVAALLDSEIVDNDIAE